MFRYRLRTILTCLAVCSLLSGCSVLSWLWEPDYEYSPNQAGVPSMDELQRGYEKYGNSI